MSITQTLRVMKLTAILLTVCCVHLMAAAGAQTISYSGKNVSLNEIFKVVKKQTGYFVVYNATEVNAKQAVTVSVKDQPLTQFLNTVLKDLDLAYTIENRTIVISYKEKKIAARAAQELAQGAEAAIIDIRGMVTDESGKPVVGASVVVKGTNKGTTTNNDGEFFLVGVDDKAILVISAINIEIREIEVNGRKELSLVAKLKVSKLEDVEITAVNTGYQLIPKERATGSFSYIDNKLFNQQVTPDITSRLEAVANGLYFDRSTSSPGLRVRGLSTINGPKSPLIIIDNFPFEGDINNLNPNDIENITLLKDAAASSIWGTKAGNGVIVITTKKSKLNQAIQTEINVNTTIIRKPNLNYFKQASSSDYIDAEIFLFSKGFRFSDTGNALRPPFSPVYELLFNKRNGTLPSSEADNRINALRSYDVRDEYEKYFYSAGLNQQYALTARGGTDKHSWLISGGVDQNISNLDVKYKRATGRLQNTFLIAKRLTINIGATFSETNNISGKPGYGNVTSNLGLYPYARFADDNGLPLPYPKNLRLSYLDTAGSGRLLDWKYYPINNFQHETTNEKIQNLLINVGLEYSLFKNFKINALYQLERENVNNKKLFDAESYYARDLVNSFTQINSSVNYKVPIGGVLDRDINSLSGNNFRIGLNYTNSWKKNELILIAGNEIRERKYTTGGYRTYGYNEDPQTGSTVDNINLYPYYVNGSSSQIPGYNVGSSTSLTRYVSFYGNAAYTFDKKYTLSISARRDASNLFGVNTNNKWTPLWSTGVNYKLSNEKYYKLDFLPYLNLRLTYGYNGNVNPSSFGFTTTTSGNISPYTQTTTYSFLSYYNPELRWERVGTTNVGIDFGFKKSWLKGSVDYYIKNADDLLNSVPIDYTGGIGPTIKKNVAKIQSKGVDINLQALIMNGPITWVTDLNFSSNSDKVVKYYIVSARGSFFVGKRATVNPAEGQPVFGMYSYKWAGLDPLNGDPQGLIRGSISKNYSQLTGATTLISDLVYNGSVLPKVFGSWGHTFSWKNLSFTARLTFKMGHSIRRPSVEYSTLTTSTFQHIDLGNRWQRTGDELNTNVPSMPYPNVSARDAFYLNSETLVEKADHVRLQYVALNYNIESKTLMKAGVKKMDLYLSGNNLGIIWRANKLNIDPEYVNGLPPSVGISFGLRVTFN